MSGYGSRAEVVAVVKATIRDDTNQTGLSRDPADYFVSRVVADNFANRGRLYGWGTTTSAEQFVASLHRHLRR